MDFVMGTELCIEHADWIEFLVSRLLLFRTVLRLLQIAENEIEIETNIFHRRQNFLSKKWIRY